MCRKKELISWIAKAQSRQTSIDDHIRTRIDITTPMHCPRLKRLQAKLLHPSSLITARFSEKEQQSMNPTMTTATPSRYMFLRKQLTMTRMMTSTNSLLAMMRILLLDHLSENMMKKRPPRNSPAPQSIRILKVRLLSSTGESPSLNAEDIRTEMNVQMKAIIVPERQNEGTTLYSSLLEGVGVVSTKGYVNPLSPIDPFTTDSLVSITSTPTSSPLSLTSFTNRNSTETNPINTVITTQQQVCPSTSTICEESRFPKIFEACITPILIPKYIEALSFVEHSLIQFHWELQSAETISPPTMFTRQVPMKMNVDLYLETMVKTMVEATQMRYPKEPRQKVQLQRILLRYLLQREPTPEKKQRIMVVTGPAQGRWFCQVIWDMMPMTLLATDWQAKNTNDRYITFQI